jgi:protocatechuate 3,4-dioxygenase beta subunit
MTPSRRQALLLGTGLVSSPWLPGCSSADDAAKGSSPDVPWATGGTKAMTAKATYPNPFISRPTTMCAVVCDLERGPCYSNESEEVVDISYGFDGLPTRIALRLLDEDCAPRVGYEVRIWHVSYAGHYSGRDEEHMLLNFCTGNEEENKSHLYFRGRQTTGTDGSVYFDSCFPGFYTGRTTHVHIVIARDGQLWATSEFCFADDLVADVATNHALYSTRGLPTNDNATDVVFRRTANFLDYQLEAAKMTDGALLASKTLVLLPAKDNCKTGGSSWDGQTI